MAAGLVRCGRMAALCFQRLRLPLPPPPSAPVPCLRRMSQRPPGNGDAARPGTRTPGFGGRLRFF